MPVWWDAAGSGGGMTAEQRIFLRRHWQAYGDLIPNQPVAVRRAVIRVGYAWGISAADLAGWLGVSLTTVYDTVHDRYSRIAFLERWKIAHARAQKARNELLRAEGYERAAAERARARGLELAI